MTKAERDPDLTPTATPWEEYLAAAQALDTVRRKAASASAAAAHTVSSARAELARARARLGSQRIRLVNEAVRAGVATPSLDPSPPEQEWARTTVTGGPSTTLAALRHGHTLIEAADAQLSAATSRASAATPGGRTCRTWWPSRVWLIAAVTTGLTTMLLLCVLSLLLGLALR